jgi:hypothetical protein
MEARELRKGNLTLSRWENDKVHVIRGCDISALEDGMDSEAIQPIPLTEEWLVRFGFIQYDKMGELIFFNYKPITNRYWNLCLDKKKCLFSFNGLDWDNSFELEFVHQLQNLWFALNKTELQLK